MFKPNLFFLVISFLLFQIIVGKCPINSTPGKDNNKCYYFSGTTGDFNTAERTCNEFGGHLVSICSAFENNFLDSVAVGKLQAYGAKDFWIGFTDQYNKNLWQWTSNASCPYTNWGSDQAGDYDCAALQISGGKWFGSDCLTPKSFVCETLVENVTIKPQCKDGYTYYPQWNSCYKYFTHSASYNDAEQNCTKDGGHLVSMHSKDEEEFVDTLIHDVYAWNSSWIGFVNSYPGWPDHWVWTDNTPLTYTNWGPGFPIINSSLCAYMWSSGSTENNGSIYWTNNVNCSNFNKYICKQSPVCM